MNAITMLKADHKTVSDLFRRFERSGDDAHEQKREIVRRIVEELAVHAAIEEQVFYPAIRAEVKGVEDMTLEALEEHHIVKWTLAELDGMDPREERFVPKVTVLIESVRHHVKEEENDLFPKVSKKLSRSRLNEIGEAMAKVKTVAPTHPHPRLPDTPPLNAIAGAVGMAEKVGDKVLETAKNAIDFANPLSSNGDNIEDVVEDVADTVKRTARKATRQASSATRKASATTKKTARKASATTKKTARKATATTKKTATAASSTTKRTAKKASAATKKTAARAARPSTSPRAAKKATSRTAKKATSRTAKKARATSR
jgi:hemerythrin superfamily protein